MATVLNAISSELKPFLDKQGRLTGYPARMKRKICALFYLASKFEKGSKYTEKEINKILNEWHTFADWPLLRRDLCERRFLGREKDGGLYWLEEPQPMLESFGLG